MDVFDRNRSRVPFLPGDLFQNCKGQEFTILHLGENTIYGALSTQNEGGVVLKKYPNLSKLLDDGFIVNAEYLEKEKEIHQTMGLFAPRRLKDGTWAALTRLVATTAICVDFDADNMGISMYESRYCFGPNRVLPHYGNASYWLAQLENKESLPVGNCAYRGRLGTQPILDTEYTLNFYRMMHYLHEYPALEGLDIHGVCDMVMREVLDPYLPEQFKADKSLSAPANFEPRFNRQMCSLI